MMNTKLKTRQGRDKWQNTIKRMNKRIEEHWHK